MKKTWILTTLSLVFGGSFIYACLPGPPSMNDLVQSKWIVMAEVVDIHETKADRWDHTIRVDYKVKSVLVGKFQPKSISVDHSPYLSKPFVPQKNSSYILFLSEYDKKASLYHFTNSKNIMGMYAKHTCWLAKFLSKNDVKKLQKFILEKRNHYDQKKYDDDHKIDVLCTKCNTNENVVWQIKFTKEKNTWEYCCIECQNRWQNDLFENLKKPL